MLPVLRPGDAALSGEEGLIACLHACALREGASPEWSRERWHQSLTSEGLTASLDRLRKMAASRLVAMSDDGDPEPPMPILMIDQGEELFSEQAGIEGRRLLALMTDALRLDAMMVVICLRPEACERWQNLPGMDGVEQRFYLLPKIPQALVKDIIEGPAQRDRDTYGRDGLQIDPLLTERLLQEWAGEDALPLLALTLRRLHEAHGASGRLELAAYESAGGLGGMLDAAIEQAVDRAIEVGAMPRDPARRQAMVQRTFVPALIAIHPQTQAPLRRIARFDLLPPESQGLVRALLDARLLSESVRQIDGVPRRLVEVAHEALLRQWPALRQAVDRELAARARLEGLARTAAAWWDSGRSDAALRDGAESLRDIESLLERPDLRASMNDTTRAYLAECRAQEARLRLQAQWRARRNRAAAFIRRHAVRGTATLFTAAILAAYGASAWRSHAELTTLLALSRQKSESGMHAAALRYALSAAKHQSLWSPRESRATREQLRMLASQPIWSMKWYRNTESFGNVILRADGAQLTITEEHITEWDPVVLFGVRFFLLDARTMNRSQLMNSSHISSIRYSRDGKFIAVSEDEPEVKIFDTKTHKFETVFSAGNSDAKDAIFNPNGTSILLISSESTEAIVWKKSLEKLSSTSSWSNPNVLGKLTHEAIIGMGTFGPEGRMLATGSSDGVIKLWDSKDGDLIRPLPENGDVTHLLFNQDETRLLSQSRDGRIHVWDTRTGALVGNHQGDRKIQPAFSPDGRHFAMAFPDGTFAIHDSGSGNRLMDIQHRDRIGAFEFSHDGRQVATASNDGEIRITDLAKKTTVQMLSRTEAATGIRFSTDDRRLLVRGLSETVLMDVSKRKILIALPIGTSIHFSHAGDLFAATVYDTIYLFNFSPLSPDARSAIDSSDDDALVDTFCRIVSPSAGSVHGASGVPGFHSEHTDTELSQAQFLDPETERDPCRPATP